MNEFWALVLGSALAVGGGIVGTIFTQWLMNRNEKLKEKKEAYEEILKFCNRLKFIDSKAWTNVTSEYLTEVLSKTLLYASDTVAKEYKKIHNLAVDISEANEKKDKKEIENIRKKLASHIEVISAQMKKELKLESKRSKELLSKTIDKKDKENENGN